MLEKLYRDESLGKVKTTTGGVVANDVDYQRAYTLVHQLKRINTAGIAITNFPA